MLASTRALGTGSCKRFKTVVFCGVLFLALMVPTEVHANCPGTPQCSGHGECHGHKCYCFNQTENDHGIIKSIPSYTGGDCSLRPCPLARSFSAVKTNDWKHYVECGGAGLCNREKGVCECFEGFDGKACTRDHRRCFASKKFGYCSGHGSCVSVFDYMNKLQGHAGYRREGEHKESINPRVHNNIGANYEQTWNTNNVFVCDCEAAYFGARCEKIQCPSSDLDPLKPPLGIDEVMEANLHGRECSGRGICNHKNGVCACFDGFDGRSCEKIDFSYLDIGNPNSVEQTSVHQERRYEMDFDHSVEAHPFDPSKWRYN